MKKTASHSNAQLPRRILVSGGAGFIGSALVRYLVNVQQLEVINVDALTYAGDLSALSAVGESARHFFYRQDIRDADALAQLFMKTQPQAVMHLAAETHVDRSIDAPEVFVQTNVLGTLNMLEAARAYWQQLPAAQQAQFRFLHVSTDEVYGDLAAGAEPADEQTPYAPSSPYAASKAGADHLVRSWYRTYGLPVLLTHCCNNYGAYQYPEKLIPHMILNALAGQPLPVYGDGLQQRQWLFVDDHVRALWRVLCAGRVGESYHISVPETMSNLDVVRQICHVLEALVPVHPQAVKSYASLIRHVPDRPGHDRRYALSSDKIRHELGWLPQVSLEQGLRQTVAWYVQNPSWWQQVLARGYDLQRQGLAACGGGV